MIMIILDYNSSVMIITIFAFRMFLVTAMCMLKSWKQMKRYIQLWNQPPSPLKICPKPMKFTYSPFNDHHTKGDIIIMFIVWNTINIIKCLYIVHMFFYVLNIFTHHNTGLVNIVYWCVYSSRRMRWGKIELIRIEYRIE